MKSASRPCSSSNALRRSRRSAYSSSSIAIDPFCNVSGQPGDVREKTGRIARMELIHTCYRITEIDRSVAFYTALGFEERRRLPIREEAINVFMGLPGAGDQLELTYNFGVDSYELGTG